MADRYKKRGLKFNNNLDSRVLRAVNHQQRQRGRRDEVVSSRRQMEALQDSPQVTGPPKIPASNVDKKAIQQQKGLERYQQLVKWKEMKKKQLEKEKKKRMPAFNTGIYQPSPPRYLVSGDQKELGKTPQASLKKKAITPGASLRKVPVFHLGGTPATSLLRLPQFHTGLTPNVSTKKQILTSKKHSKLEGQGVAQRTRGARKNEGTKVGRSGARGRTSRQTKSDEQDDLGVQPLPLTPLQAASQRKMEKPVLPLQGLPFSSFAPTDFAFNFKAPQIPKTECPSTDCSDALLTPPCMEEVPQDHVNDKKEDCGPVEASESEVQPTRQNNSSLQEEKYACISESNESEVQPANQEKSSPQQDKHTVILETSGCGIESESDTKNVDEALTDKIPEDFQAANDPELSCNSIKLDEDPMINEHKEDTGRNQMIADDDCLSPGGMHTSRLEVQKEKKSKPKKSGRPATPAKYLSRRSVSCCFDGTVTPTVSRLRPRTPCSRSTRRSLSAHCDTPFELYTPVKRSSVSKANKLKVLRETHDTSLLPVLLDNKITAIGSPSHDTEAEMKATEKSQPLLDPHKTTTVVQLKSQKESGSPLMTPENVFRREHGMWTVETSPWINAQRSKKKKKSQTSDLHGMFNDVLADGLSTPLHLIPSAPVSTVVETNESEDTVCTKLLPLLQPSTPHNTESPEVDVWGESPAPDVLRTPKTSNLQQSLQGEKIPLEEAADVSKDVETAGHRRGTKKSRKSVMFAIAEQENMNTYKIPGTPISTSSRVSMGLFAKIDLNVEQPISQEQDLMVFESPKSEKRTSCTRRRSCRISLLPGMTPSPAKETAAPIPTDLMTWDSPEPRRTSRYAASSLATPLRRSRRLSKAL